MFAKPLSMTLVYIVTICNIVVMSSPLLALTIPFLSFHNHSLVVEYGLIQKIKLGFCFLTFLVSFLMLAYLMLDLLFGFALRASLKGCVRHEKLKEYDFLTGIFDQVKNKFGAKSAKLYVKNTDEINAYAIASMGSKAMVLTRGLINHYLVECPDPKKFLYALRSIMGHEMSHLINKDFLPTYLIINNQKITNFISRILHILFDWIGFAVSFIPYTGRYSLRLMHSAYSMLNLILTSFNRLVVYNLYEFLRRFISRSIEFRCDYQSSKAFGGKHMALALSMLSEGGYLTLFSTHPRTSARIKKAENVQISDAVVTPRFFDSLANYFSLMFLAIICLYFAKQAGVDLMARKYLKNHEVINRKLGMLWHLVSSIY